MSRTLLLMLLTTAALGTAGCQSCCRRPQPPRPACAPGAPCPPGAGRVTVPPPPAPIGGPPGTPIVTPPPPSFPPGGAAPTITPVAPTAPGAMPPVPPPPPAPVPGSASLSPPRLEPNWQPAEARVAPPVVAQAVPDPLLARPLPPASPTMPPAAPAAPAAPATPATPPTPKLYPPEVTEQKTGEPPLIEEKKSPAVPPAPGPKKATLPAGIAQFAVVIDGKVWSGQRPAIEDGLEWLKKNGYRAVLHLKSPQEDDAGDRKQVLDRGMTYLVLDVSPKLLTRERVDAFVKALGEVAYQPLFVYDQDGSLAGPMWYLYFRRLGDSDETARIRVGALGFQLDGDAAQRPMWLAVQGFLKENP